MHSVRSSVNRITICIADAYFAYFLAAKNSSGCLLLLEVASYSVQFPRLFPTVVLTPLLHA